MKSHPLILSATLALSFTFGVTAPSSAAPQIWTASSLENIFKDTSVPSTPVTAITWLTARNEYESAQVCLRNSTAFTINSVAFTNLTKGSDLIPAAALKYNFVEYVHYNNNTFGLVQKVRVAPADYPDPLSNAASLAVEANTTQPVWFTVKVPKVQPTGVYLGSATINTSAGSVVVPISLEVVAAQIPDASAGFPNVPMLSLSYGEDEGIPPEYGFPKYTPEWWDIVGKLADNAVANRTNVAYIVGIQLLIDGGSTKNGDTYNFNWSKFDQMVEFLLARGYRYIWDEGLCYSAYTGSDPDVFVSAIQGNATDGFWWGGHLVGNNKANIYLNQYLPALKAHLQSKGWLDIFHLQVLDEPRDYQHDEWNAVAAMVPPEIKLIETFSPDHTVAQLSTHEGLIDAWMPSINLYEQHKTYFDSRQVAGDEKWFYITGGIGGNWLDRVIDAPVYQGRLIFWYAHRFNLDGYLHFGYNSWQSDWDASAHGSAWIIYPDPAHSNVKSSIREANQRDGIEELELIRQLAALNPTLASAIVNSVVTDGNSYSNSVGQILGAREQLLRAIASGGNQTPAPSLTAYYTLNNLTAGIQNSGTDGATSNLSPASSGATPTAATGIIGGALSFDGNDVLGAFTASPPNFMAGNAGSDLEAGYPYSIAFWYQVAGTTAGGTAVGVSQVASSDRYITTGVTSGQPHIWRRNTTLYTMTGSGFPVGAWHHVVAVFSGQANTLLYVDGKLALTNTTTGVPMMGASSLSLGGFYRSTTQLLSPFNGLLDDVGIFHNGGGSGLVLTAADAALINGLGRTGAIGLDQLANARNLANASVGANASIGGATWQRVSGLTGTLGDWGGSVANGDAFIVTGASGNGIRVGSSAPLVVLHQAESLSFTASDSVTQFNDTAASAGSADRLDANAVGDFLTYSVPVSQTGTYNVKIRYKRYTERGQFQLSIDGTNVGGIVDEYGTTQTWVEVDLGNATISATGNRSFKFTVVGKNAANTSSNYSICVDYIKLTRN